MPASPPSRSNSSGDAPPAPPPPTLDSLTSSLSLSLLPMLPNRTPPPSMSSRPPKLSPSSPSLPPSSQETGLPYRSYSTVGVGLSSAKRAVELARSKPTPPGRGPTAAATSGEAGRSLGKRPMPFEAPSSGGDRPPRCAGWPPCGCARGMPRIPGPASASAPRPKKPVDGFLGLVSVSNV
eukprot:321977-Chlamydomonas_euryale.AAC.1